MADLRTRRRRDTRAEIIAAAWRLAEVDGIAELSLRDLATEVGMRAPSLYNYFASKAEIYDAMFVEGFRELDRTIPGPEAAVLGGREDRQTDRRVLLCDALTGWLHFCLASVPRYQLLFTRAVPGWHPSDEAYATSIESYGRMEDLLARLGIAGAETLDLWTALTAGLAAQQVANDPDGDRWIRRVPDAVDMFLQFIDLGGAHERHG